MPLRHRSIRVRILALVMAPMLALIGLYAFLVAVTYGNYQTLSRAEAVHDAITRPTIRLQNQLDAERALAMQYVSRPTRAGLIRLRQQQSRTDAAVTNFAQAEIAPAVLAYGGPGVLKSMRVLSDGLSPRVLFPAPGGSGKPRLSLRLLTLGGLRAGTETRFLGALPVLLGYLQLVIDGNFVRQQSILDLAGGSTALQSNALIGMDQVRQTLLQENDLLRAARRSGRFGPQARHAFAELVAVRTSLLAAVQPDLTPAAQIDFASAVPRQLADRILAMERAVIKLPSGHRLGTAHLRQWGPSVATYNARFLAAENKTSAALDSQAKADLGATALRLTLAATLGLLAILVAAGVAVLVGRRVIRQLSALRQSALELADRELPGVIARLRAGEDVNIDDHALVVPPSSDEIDQVRQAFAIVQRTALEAAVEEAMVRRGVNDVFRNLARRSQSLLSRQLALLDSLERHAQGPDELANLFRLDHLTTRMRRHAEGLLILAGGTSGRSWRDPVPVIDVLRASAAEVEDYTRFRVLSTTSASIAGYAVADVVHLLAELAENATLFSPVNAPIRVEGSAVARGVAVEIEDRGLGISEAQLAHLNARLADPPQFDLSGSDQLGLFIAAKLAKRHDIKVTLRQSAFGGTIAIVLIPAPLVVDAEPEGALPAGTASQFITARQMPELPAAGTVAVRGPDSAAPPWPADIAPAAEPDTGVLATLFAGDVPWANGAPQDAGPPPGQVAGSPPGQVAGSPPGQVAWANRPPWPDAEPPAQLTSGMGFFTPAAEPDSPGWAALAPPPPAGIGSSPASSPAFRPPSSSQRPPWEDAEPPGHAPAGAGPAVYRPAWDAPDADADLAGWATADAAAGRPAWGTPDAAADLPVRRPAAVNGDRHPPGGPDSRPEAPDVTASWPAAPDPAGVPAGGDAGELPESPARAPAAAADGGEPPGDHGRPARPAAGTVRHGADAADLPVRQPAAPSANAGSGADAGDAAEPRPPARPGPGGPGEVSGLPVRVRQANLAPQLRRGRAAEDRLADTASAPVPEEVRNRMSAWQRGSERGRSVPVPDDDPDPPPEDRP